MLIDKRILPVTSDKIIYFASYINDMRFNFYNI